MGTSKSRPTTEHFNSEGDKHQANALDGQTPPTGKRRVDDAGTALPVRSEPERGTSSELASNKAARRKLMVGLLLKLARAQKLQTWVEQDLAHFEDTVMEAGLRAIRRAIREDKVSACSYMCKRVTA